MGGATRSKCARYARAKNRLATRQHSALRLILYMA